MPTLSDRIALIDGDIITYCAGFASDQREYHVLDSAGRTLSKHKYKKDAVDAFAITFNARTIEKRVTPEPWEFCRHSVDMLMNAIIQDTECDDHHVFLSPKGESSFRYKLATTQPYKGNRIAAHKPLHYKAIRRHLINQWGARYHYKYEADDLLAAEAVSLNRVGEEPVICTLDKDLDTISGLHYNWKRKKEKFQFISETAAMVNFYTQVLTGDRADNIPGLQGIGQKRAWNILAACKTETELYEACHNAYTARGLDSQYAEILSLLFIQRHRDFSTSSFALNVFVPPHAREHLTGYW